MIDLLSVYEVLNDVNTQDRGETESCSRGARSGWRDARERPPSFGQCVLVWDASYDRIVRARWSRNAFCVVDERKRHVMGKSFRYWKPATP